MLTVQLMTVLLMIVQRMTLTNHSATPTQKHFESDLSDDDESATIECLMQMELYRFHYERQY